MGVRAALRLIFAISILWLGGGMTTAQAVQLFRYDGVVKPAGYASGPANVAICTTSSATTPCASLAVVYSDQNGSSMIQGAFPADINGHYYFYAAQGTYVVQTYGSGYTTTNTVVTLGAPTPGTVAPNAISPVYNAKNYGAVGDARSVIDGVTSNGSTTVTSATAAWSSADVGKLFWCVKPSNGSFSTSLTTIASVQSATSVTLAAAANTNAGSAQNCVWGTQDDTSDILAASTAAINGVTSSNGAQHVTGPSLKQPGTVYVPAGGYIVSSAIYNFSNVSGQNFVVAPNLIGEGRGSTIFYLSPSFSLANGPLINLQGGSFFKFDSFGIEGSMGAFNVGASPSGVVFLNGVDNCWLSNIEANDIGFNTGGGNGRVLYLSSARECTLYSLSEQQMPAGGIAYGLYINSSDGILVANSLFSNYYQNIIINASGTRNTANHSIMFINGFVDECAAGANQGCTLLLSSTANFSGTTLMGGNGASGLQLQNGGPGPSIAYLTDDNVGSFTNSGNMSAILIDATSSVFSSMSTIRGNGTSAAISNSGAFFDVGGNTYQNCVNTTCTAATIAQSFSGNQPFESLSHSATNPFIPTDTAQTWMQMTPDQPIRVVRIQVTPGNGASVSCTVTPVFQITNGTTTQTVNIANATATDDSGVISSGNTYVSGTAMTFGISAAGTCTTAPANMNVNVLWQAVAPSQ